MAVSARKRLNNDKYNAKCTQINLKPLTPEEKHVIVDKGTEAPFTGRYYKHNLSLIHI